VHPCDQNVTCPQSRGLPSWHLGSLVVWLFGTSVQSRRLSNVVNCHRHATGTGTNRPWHKSRIFDWYRA